MRYIHQSIGDETGRLDRRMQRQILSPISLHGIDGRIVPDVDAVAAVPPKLDHVQVRPASDSEYKNQFML